MPIELVVIIISALIIAAVVFAFNAYKDLVESLTSDMMDSIPDEITSYMISYILEELGDGDQLEFETSLVLVNTNLIDKLCNRLPDFEINVETDSISYTTKLTIIRKSTI